MMSAVYIYVAIGLIMAVFAFIGVSRIGLIDEYTTAKVVAAMLFTTVSWPLLLIIVLIKAIKGRKDEDNEERKN